VIRHGGSEALFLQNPSSSSLLRSSDSFIPSGAVSPPSQLQYRELPFEKWNSSKTQAYHPRPKSSPCIPLICRNSIAVIKQNVLKIEWLINKIFHGHEEEYGNQSSGHLNNLPTFDMLHSHTFSWQYLLYFSSHSGRKKPSSFSMNWILRISYFSLIPSSHFPFLTSISNFWSSKSSALASFMDLSDSFRAETNSSSIK